MYSAPRLTIDDYGLAEISASRFDPGGTQPDQHPIRVRKELRLL